MEKKPFTELGLSPEMLKAVAKMGFEEASPIQTAVIPVILSGRDVVGQSSTGSGKTAAFAIPALERVDPQVKAVQVLVLERGRGRMQIQGQAIQELLPNQPVLLPAGVPHWHGAAPNEGLTQIAVNVGSLKWMAAVTDDEYLGRR